MFLSHPRLGLLHRQRRARFFDPGMGSNTGHEVVRGIQLDQYLSGLERVRFEKGGILVEKPMIAPRHYPDIELISWYVYDPEGMRKRLSSDSFVRFRTPERRRPVTQRLWGDLDGLRDLRATLLLIAPEKEVLSTLGQLFPAFA